MELLPLPRRALQEELWKERQKLERETANGFMQSNDMLRNSLFQHSILKYSLETHALYFRTAIVLLFILLHYI